MVPGEDDRGTVRDRGIGNVCKKVIVRLDLVIYAKEEGKEAKEWSKSEKWKQAEV